MKKITLGDLRRQVTLTRSELEQLIGMILDGDASLIVKHAFTNVEIDQMNKTLVMLTSKELRK
jgi:hypothetical protein